MVGEEGRTYVRPAAFHAKTILTVCMVGGLVGLRGGGIDRSGRESRKMIAAEKIPAQSLDGRIRALGVTWCGSNVTCIPDHNQFIHTAS